MQHLDETTITLTGQTWLATSVEVGDLVVSPISGDLVRVTSTVPFDEVGLVGHVGIFGVDVRTGDEVAFTPAPMQRVWVADR